MVCQLIKEHERFTHYDGKYPHERYEKISSCEHPLLEWTYTPFVKDEGPGYYASYNIGAQWVDSEEAIVVTTKEKMERIDFVKMFMTCFNSHLAVNEFNKIYEINVGEPPIVVTSLPSVVSPLIVIHFLSVVERIKTLKKGYVRRGENLKKVKGHINILKNERLNIMPKRYDRIYCEYDEYAVDIPENRLIKKALLFAKQVVMNMGGKSRAMSKLRVLLAKDMAMFEHVSPEVEIRDVRLIRGHNLYTEYKEAIRLAKLILRHFDYNINNASCNREEVVPFVIDMSLLYEHYVLGLLCEAYDKNGSNKIIDYQFVGKNRERPDFLFCSSAFKAILDTKYKPRYDKNGRLYTADVRQLSGYGRDLKILSELGYEDIDESSPVQDVPCIIIYPTEGGDATNPFMSKDLEQFCVDENKVNGWSRFYKIAVPLPTIAEQNVFATYNKN